MTQISLITYYSTKKSLLVYKMVISKENSTTLKITLLGYSKAATTSSWISSETRRNQQLESILKRRRTALNKM